MGMVGDGNDCCGDGAGMGMKATGMGTMLKIVVGMGWG